MSDRKSRASAIANYFRKKKKKKEDEESYAGLAKSITGAIKRRKKKY